MLDWLEELGCRKDNDQMNRDDKMNRRQNTTQKNQRRRSRGNGAFVLPFE
jgi:hypothetical protein